MIVKLDFEVEEFPKYCSDCPVLDSMGYDGSPPYCFALGAYISEDKAENSRHRFCPLKVVDDSTETK